MSNPQSPWPGLLPYEEKDRDYFQGREAEATRLLRALQREPLTVLYGQSGLGKTSLLQAGLFPKLREAGAFPVRIRLAFDALAPTLTQQVLDEIAKAAVHARKLYCENRDYHVTVPSVPDDAAPRLTLWEYFHRRDHYFWTGLNRIAMPVLVFDQFEEWFTRGTRLSLEQRQAFLTELHQLLDNDPPSHCEDVDNWNFERIPLSIVITLREDYLAYLTSLHETLPGLRASEVRLVPFTEAQARKVIEKPAPWTATEDFTRASLAALRRAAKISAPTVATLGSGTDYDPAILSLLLNRLFPSLYTAKTSQEREGIIRDQGQNVLLVFYREVLDEASASDRERAFFEEQLVTDTGLRNSVSLDNATRRFGVRRVVLEHLRESRLLHFDDRAMGHERVELAHDVLCEVVWRLRDERRVFLARRRWEHAIAAAFVAVLVVFLFGWQRFNEAAAREERSAFLRDVENLERKARDENLDDFENTYAKLIERAEQETSRLNSSDLRYQFATIARSAELLAENYVRENKSAKASGIFGQALNARKKIIELQPEDSDAQVDLSQTQHRVGNVYLKLGDTTRALQAFRVDLEISQKLAAKDPQNTDWQHSLALSHSQVGGVLLAQGDLAGALQAFRVCEEISQKRATQDPQNTDWQHSLALSHGQVGGVLLAQGDLAGALQAFRVYQEISQKLATQDPQNTAWQHRLGVSNSQVGSVLLAQGDLAGALQAFRVYQEISQKLAAKDPQNTDWQHSLALSHSQVGSVLLAQGDLAGALQAFRVYQEIFQKLAAKDPQNTDWQHSLALSHGQVGGVLLAQGDLAGALQAFRVYQEISQKLAAQDPRNTDWQHSLAFGHSRLGDVYTKLLDFPSAIASYRAALASIAPLVNRKDKPVSWNWTLVRIQAGYANVLRLSGQAQIALTELSKAEAAAGAATEASPQNILYRAGKALVALRFGETLLAIEPPRTAEALTRLLEGRDRLLALKQNPGLTFEQLQWLEELEREISMAWR